MVIDDYRRWGIGDELFRLRTQRGAFVPSPSLLLPLIRERHMGAPLRGNLFYYVEYSLGFIQYTEIPVGASYGISDKFSGCAMAYFVFNNTRYIAHISLDTIPDFDKRVDWNTFVTQNQRSITQYAIFRPFDLNSEIGDFSVLNFHQIDRVGMAVGIITPNLECYSALSDSAHRLLYFRHETNRRHFTNNLSIEANIGPYLIPNNTRGW